MWEGLDVARVPIGVDEVVVRRCQLLRKNRPYRHGLLRLEHPLQSDVSPCENPDSQTRGVRSLLDSRCLPWTTRSTRRTY